MLGKVAKHPFLLRFTNSCVSKGNKAKHPFLMWFTLFHCVLTVFHCVVSTRSENHSFSLSFHCVLCRQSQQSTPFPLSLASEAYWLWAKEDGTNCADAVDIDRKTCMGGRNANSTQIVLNWLLLIELFNYAPWQVPVRNMEEHMRRVCLNTSTCKQNHRTKWNQGYM